MAPNTDIPYGNALLLDKIIWPGLVTGFDLDRGGPLELTGPGNMLFVSNTQPEAAEMLHDIFDMDVSGTWEATGRARYVESSEYALVLVNQ